MSIIKDIFFMEAEAKIAESIKRSIKKGGGKHKTKNKKK